MAPVEIESFKKKFDARQEGWQLNKVVLFP